MLSSSRCAVPLIVLPVIFNSIDVILAPASPFSPLRFLNVKLRLLSSIVTPTEGVPIFASTLAVAPVIDESPQPLDLGNTTIFAAETAVLLIMRIIIPEGTSRSIIRFLGLSSGITS